jgi:hypothetical protein
VNSSDSEPKIRGPVGLPRSEPHTVTIPLSYFHLLCRAYYGTQPVKTESPHVTSGGSDPEVHEAPDDVKQMVLATVYPPGMKPRGAAARKRERDGGQYASSNDSDMRDPGSSYDGPRDPDDHP